jgi:predicted ester cyclase
MSQPTENLSVVRRFVEGFLGKADPSIADATVASDIVVTTGLSPTGPIQGREAYKQIFLSFAAAFPLKSFTVDEIFGVDDRAVARFTAVATHEGEYFGVAATRRPIVLKEAHIMRLQGGRIVENIVSAANLEFEMLMAPVLAPLILK